MFIDPGALRLQDLIVAGDRDTAHLMHALFHRHVYRVGLVGVESFAGIKLGDQGQVIGAVAVQEIRTCLQADHSLNLSLHAVKVLYQLGNLILEFILDFEHNDVTDHWFSPLSVVSG